MTRCFRAPSKLLGSIKGKDAMMKEIFNRGPIACNVDANYILNYTTGIVTAKSGAQGGVLLLKMAATHGGQAPKAKTSHKQHQTTRNMLPPGALRHTT